MGNSASIPFREWFAYAVSALGLSPRSFWELTIAEWRWLAPEAPGAMTQEGLAALVARYPDRKGALGNDNE